MESAEQTSKPKTAKPVHKPIRKRAVKKAARRRIGFFHHPFDEFEVEQVAFAVGTIVAFGIRVYKAFRDNNRKS